MRAVILESPPYPIETSTSQLPRPPTALQPLHSLSLHSVHYPNRPASSNKSAAAVRGARRVDFRAHKRSTQAPTATPRLSTPGNAGRTVRPPREHAATPTVESYRAYIGGQRVGRSRRGGAQSFNTTTSRHSQTTNPQLELSLGIPAGCQTPHRFRATWVAPRPRSRNTGHEHVSHVPGQRCDVCGPLSRAPRHANGKSTFFFQVGLLSIDKLPRPTAFRVSACVYLSAAGQPGAPGRPFYRYTAVPPVTSYLVPHAVVSFLNHCHFL